MKSKRFTSWPELLEAVSAEVEAFRRRWTSPAAVPFFRGHGETEFTLAPGLLRSCGMNWYTDFDEQNLYYEFKSRAASLLPHPVDSWDVLFRMQHHGVPTRLLDWSESFAAALFFALEGGSGDLDVWFLDPYTFNQANGMDDDIVDVESDLKQSYERYFILKEKAVPEWQDAVAIYPPRRSTRLAGQSGTFTLHATRAPLESLPHQGLARFTLSQDARPEAKLYLDLVGLNDFTMFPDLDGLAKLLRKRFRPINQCSLP